MTRPSTSTSRRRRLGFAILIAMLPLRATAGGEASSTGDAMTPLWGSALELSGRLAEERRKLDDLRAGIQNLRFAAEDFRDLQLYDPAILHYGTAEEAALDRRIEGLEKNTRKTALKAEDLGRSLRDAVFVTREMVQGSPNRDMMQILMKDNVDRIAAYLALNREIQSRWDSALAVVRAARKNSGIPVDPNLDGRDDDFFRALRANTGTAAAKFQQEFQAYKDSLAAGTTRRQDWERMARIDLARVEKRIQAGSMNRTRDRTWVLEDLEHLTHRFSGRFAIGIIGHFLGEAWLESGQPLKAEAAFAQVESGGHTYASSQLGILRSFFAAGLDDSVLSRYGAMIQAGVFSDTLRFPARYLELQSLYALGRDSLIESEVLSTEDRGPYHNRILFLYAKSLVRLGRRPEARQTLAALAGQAAEAGLRREVEMDLAHLDYENELYESALRGYQGLLDDSVFRPEALYGMVWCNIRLGDYDGAEFVLKQLITQHPDTPWAMDGFMVFIRKLMLKARDEWDYRLQVEGNGVKLKELETKLAARKAEGTEDLEEKDLQSRVHQAREALAKTRPFTPEQVAALYQQALNLCAFVDARYRTGEFSQVGFLDAREAVLSKLGQAETGSVDSTAAAAAEAHRRKMLEKLSQTRMLALNIDLLHQSWLEDLLRYYETHLQTEIATARGQGDTVSAGKLTTQAQRLADQMSERIEAKSDDILDRISELASDPSAADRMDWLLFQRGYLRYNESEDAMKRRLALNRMLAENDSTSAEEDRPINHQAYEEPWLELLRRYPESPYVPATLYFLGYSRTARGESESGLQQFEELAAHFPESPYAQQALIFIGEHYFNDNDLAKAEKAYDQVLDHPDSKYFDQALYKLAWTRYRANTYKSAISSFTYLLEESQAQPKNQGKNLLTQESLQYTALSLAESDTSGDDGFERSEAFSQRLGDPSIGAELLHKMAGIYLQQGRLERAKRAFQALVKRYPNYAQLPSAQIELAQAYDKDQDFAKGAEIRGKVFDQYGPGTAWYNGLKSPEARATADTLFEHAIDDVARQNLYAAKRVQDSSADSTARRRFLYRKAINDYDRFLAVYPSHPHKARYLYQQAEAYYAMEDYGAAARKYLEVSQTAAQPKLAVISAYNAIVAAQELTRKAEDHAEK